MQFAVTKSVAVFVKMSFCHNVPRSIRKGYNSVSKQDRKMILMFLTRFSGLRNTMEVIRTILDGPLNFKIQYGCQKALEKPQNPQFGYISGSMQDKIMILMSKSGYCDNELYTN